MFRREHCRFQVNLDPTAFFPFPCCQALHWCATFPRWPDTSPGLDTSIGSFVAGNAYKTRRVDHQIWGRHQQRCLALSQLVYSRDQNPQRKSRLVGPTACERTHDPFEIMGYQGRFHLKTDLRFLDITMTTNFLNSGQANWGAYAKVPDQSCGFGALDFWAFGVATFLQGYGFHEFSMSHTS